MIKRIFLYCFAALLLGCAQRAEAQFIGYTSPQTVNSNVFTNQSTPATVVISNLGQNVHSFSYTTSGACLNLDVRLEASNNGSTFFGISPDATDSSPNATGGSTLSGGVTATGYFPVVRVNLVAISGCTISGAYSGTSSAPPPPGVGIYQQASQYRSVIAQNVTTSNAFSTINIPTPFGTSLGSIWLQCSGVCASGGFITVSAAPSDSGLGSRQIASSSVQQVSSIQRIDMPGVNTNRIFVAITPTAASANTWSIYYNFVAPGFAPLALSGAAQSNSTSIGVPACENFSPINTTSNVQLLGGAAGTKFTICSIQLVVGAADNVALVEGTGGVCSTATAGLFGGATAATGWNLAINGQISLGSGYGMVGRTAISGDSLCLLVSSAAQVSGGFTWTQY